MDNRCEELIMHQKNRLAQYDIVMTPELEDKLISLYPDESAIDNQITTILMTYIDWRET